jgi:hypothetical protein
MATEMFNLIEDPITCQLRREHGKVISGPAEEARTMEEIG